LGMGNPHMLLVVKERGDLRPTYPSTVEWSFWTGQSAIYMGVVSMVGGGVKGKKFLFN